MAKSPDMVNSPPHYTGHPSGVECIDIVEHFGFNIGNAVKYLWRCGLKGDEIEDLKKAAWYVNREIERRTRVPDAVLEVNPYCDRVGCPFQMAHSHPDPFRLDQT